MLLSVASLLWNVLSQTYVCDNVKTKSWNLIRYYEMKMGGCEQILMGNFSHWM